MFLTSFNSSVEFKICSEIPSSEGMHHIESSPPIWNINPLTRYYMVGNVSWGYSPTDSNFNFNIIVNFTVDSYMNSKFNIRFSHLLKYLIAFRIMKLESTTKITAQFKAIPQCLFFFSLLFSIYLRNVTSRLHIF